ncbi:MAG: hypothetical protein AVDCRST_MAG77-1884, partial [uncultured Chloroflexi bacterium]
GSPERTAAAGGGAGGPPRRLPRSDLGHSLPGASRRAPGGGLRRLPWRRPGPARQRHWHTRRAGPAQRRRAGGGGARQRRALPGGAARAAVPAGAHAWRAPHRASHAHYPDHAQEMESRKSDEWAPKLARRAAFGHRAGARIVVYGHTHIPTDVQHDGVWL